MGAKKLHQDTTQDESASSLNSLWARAIESTEFAPRLQQADPPQPAPNEEPNNPETFATLLRAIESTKFAAPQQQAESRQPAPDEDPDRHEALAILLRAIENTEFAASLRGEAPRVAASSAASSRATALSSNGCFSLPMSW